MVSRSLLYYFFQKNQAFFVREYFCCKNIVQNNENLYTTSVKYLHNNMSHRIQLYYIVHITQSSNTTHTFLAISEKFV